MRERWAEINPQLKRQLLAGDYSFSPLRRIHRSEDVLEIWSALDALVLKAMATQTVLDFVARICQLYEQGADLLRIGQYVKRWRGWATAARLPTCSVEPLSYACQLISTVLLSANAADASGVPPSVPAHPRLVRGCW